MNLRKHSIISIFSISILIVATLSLTVPSQSAFAQFTFRTLDATSGAFSSMDIGSDGFPIISFRNSANGLDFIHCGDVTCDLAAVGYVQRTLDPSSFVLGGQTSIAQGSDGFPIIVYHDTTTTSLKFIHCTTLDCSASPAVVILDGFTAGAGFGMEVAQGSDGFPVIAYQNGDSGSGLRVLHCATLGCTGTPTSSLIDGASNAGANPSIAIASDNNPIISYAIGGSGGMLFFADCVDVSCSSASIVNIDTVSTGVSDTSIAEGSDGNPVISYHANGPPLNGIRDLRVAHCSNATCTSAITITSLDGNSLDPNGKFSDIIIGTDGFPVISYRDSDTPSGLGANLIHCLNVSCTVADTPVELDNISGGLYTSIAIGPDGFPVVVNFNNSGGGLQFNHCDNATCTAPTWDAIYDGDVSRVGFLGGGTAIRVIIEVIPPNKRT